ncbi:MAG: DUF4465 domain-containing protein [Chitinophagales bacterium]
MKQSLRDFVLAAALFFSFSACAQTRSTFENLTLPVDTYANTTSFSSGLAQFNNVFSGGFFSGFAASTMRDSVTAGAGNQYSCMPALGASGSRTFAVGNTYGQAIIRLQGAAAGHAVVGCNITNTTFAYRSMEQGDAFAKKFGGASGNDPDWFRLTVKGWLHDTIVPGQVDFYLADYRDANNANDYIVRNWQWLNLQSLGAVDSLFFELNSSDTAGGFGMNTPAYFAIDNFVTSDGGTYSKPNAVNDSIITTYQNVRTVALLANDTFATGADITVSIISGPQVLGATATLDSNHITYTPALGLITKDTIWYSLCDVAAGCDTAMLVVDIRGLTANGISDVPADELTIAPNPLHNQFILQGVQDNTTVALTDVQGAQVNIRHLGGGQYFLDESIIPGIYVLHAQHHGVAQHIKVIVK